ncbi:ribonuclease H-like domain-containing protein [Mycena belliarum]|uniref:ribonuclease H n=1 Tax=Mycena belliarum TaxID=1033014 RepID=A0AAD6UH21_9AGAR|nr:ribonuclease H-like domain-containing protein [Mycena belliae]
MAKPKYYAVKVGRAPGIYTTWAECEAQVKGSHAARYKKFDSREEAQAWIAGNASPGKASGSTASSFESAAQQNGSESKGTKRKRADVSDETGWDVVYSDGASKGNGGEHAKAGVGVWWGHDDSKNIAERCPGVQTNNRAELIAIVRILETTPHSKRPLLIKTDSQYCRNCFESWMPKWVQNNFTTANGAPVMNELIIKYIAAHLDARARRGQQVRLQYVKAHNGEEGNEGADRLANIGAFMAPVAERDWARLQAELEGGLQAELNASAERPRPTPLEVADDNVVRILGESPPKVRKTSAVVADKPKSGPKIQAKLATTPSFIPLKSPSIPVPHITPEDLAEYANCILDDDDLLAELSD